MVITIEELFKKCQKSSEPMHCIMIGSLSIARQEGYDEGYAKASNDLAVDVGLIRRINKINRKKS